MDALKFIPPRPTGVLKRDRLLDRLAAWDDRKLVLILAEAGQGKSTLAAEYACSLRTPSVWYTLDPDDDDPALFLGRLSLAVAQARPGSSPVPAPARRRYGIGDPGQAVERWISGSPGAVAGPLLIVLDDYHATAGSRELRSIIEALLQRTPPAVRFLLLSRTRPQLDIISLRARGAVAELDGGDLRFTRQEVQSFFTGVLGTPVSADEASQITRATDGWPAGLVLLHEFLAAGPRGDLAAQLARDRRSGYRARIFDFLAREAFALLPGDLQEFLLRTSLADGLTPALMETLSGLPRDAAGPLPSVSGMVRELRRRNLFITADDQDRIIRYHALFREFLLSSLRDRWQPRRIARLAGQGARHLQTAGDAAGAIALFIDAGGFDEAARLLERSCRDLISRGQVRSVLRLVQALPPSLQDRPWFLLSRAIACRFSDPRASLAFYDRALSGFRPQREAAGRMLALAGVIEACFHSGGDFARMERAAVQAQSLLRARRSVPREARARLLLALGTAWFFIGRLDRSIDALQRAMALFQTAGDRFSQVSCAIYLAPCALYHGDFRLARDAVRRGFEAQQAIPDEPGGETALHLVRSLIHLFEGNVPEARSALGECRRLASDHRLEAMDYLVLLVGGWIEIADGAYDRAEQLLQECRQRGESGQRLFFSVSAAHLLSIVLLFRGQPERAQQLSQYTLTARDQAAGRMFRAVYLIMSGAIRSALGRHQLAERDVRAALAALQASKAAQQEANAHLMLAVIHQRTGRKAAARRHLKRGFTIGQERGFLYYAVFTPQDLRALAREAEAAGICRDHCRTLLIRLAGMSSAAPLRIHCLGGFTAVRNGATVPESRWKGSRTKGLVKLLAAQQHGRLARTSVMEVLFADTPPERQGPLFRSLLHRTRRALAGRDSSAEEGAVIRHDDGHLVLNSDLVWTDVGAFHAAVRRAETVRASGDLPKALAACESAAALYTGDLLPADAGESWTVALREQLRAAYRQTLETAAEIGESLGDRARAWTLHGMLFGHDPCHAGACRWLMAHHAAEGRRNEAVRVFERHEGALRQELGMAPDEGTRKVYRDIIGG